MNTDNRFARLSSCLLKIGPLVCGFLTLVPLTALAQETLTFYPQNNRCWNQAGNFCVGNLSGWVSYFPAATYACPFSDPLPAGAKVKSVRVSLQAARGLSGSYPLISTEVNGTQVGSAISATAPYPPNCAGGVLLFQSPDYTDGFPGYRPGATNVFNLKIANSSAQVDDYGLTVDLSFVRTNLSLGAAEPIIPTDHVLVSRCVEYTTELTGTVTNESGLPESGVLPRVKSDRGYKDIVTQPLTPSDSNGIVKASARTSRQGAAVFSGENFPTTTSAAVTFLEANFESQFWLTQYYTASEADFTGGGTVTNPCGLTGTFNKKFMAAVKLNGSGVTANGETIQYAGNGCQTVSPHGIRGLRCCGEDDRRRQDCHVVQVGS